MDDDNWRIANDEYDTWKALHQFDDFLHEEGAPDGGQPIPRKTGWRPHLLIHDDEARFARRLTPFGLLLVILVTASVAIAVALFSQTLSPPNVTQTVITKRCDVTVPSPTSVPAGSIGFVTWSCGGTTSAFFVNIPGSVTPTITRNTTTWTSTSIWKEFEGPPTTSCANAPVTKVVTSGTQVTFSGAETGGWNYCSDFVNAPNPMTPITYSWSQP